MNDTVFGWENSETTAVFKAILKLKTVKECEDFFRDILTLREIEEMAKRLEIAKKVNKGIPYSEIADKEEVSTTTVTRVAHWLHHGRGGYQIVLGRVK